MGRRRNLLIAAVVVATVLVAGACGSDGDGTAAEERTPVEKAQAQLDRATSNRDKAQTAFDASSKAFCDDADGLIAVLDRYGRILDKGQVTVGDVQTAADDLGAARKDAGGSADQAVEDHGTVLEAEATVVDATAALDAAKVVAAGGTTTTTSADSTTTTAAAPLVPKATTDRVKSAEATLQTTAKAIEANTPVAEAGVRVGSAAYAVEVAWLRLFADAGCLPTDKQEQAVKAVADYTTAVQQNLAAAGLYDGPVDGVYGPTTVDAVEALQEQAHLPVTGLVDPATDRALDAAVAQTAGSVAFGVTARTAAIQGALKALGYWDGPTDGTPSAALTDAIVQLQNDLGIEPTGVVDPATLDAIASAVEGAKEDATTTTTTTTVPDAEPPSSTAPATTTTAPG